MKTLTITEARKNLGQLCSAAADGESVGIICGSQIFQLRLVDVVSWEETYPAKEYGLSLREMESFVERADADVAQRQQADGYVRFAGKFDPAAFK